MIVSARLATLIELDRDYGLEDAWTLLEIVLVDRENERRAIEKARNERP